MGSEAHEPDVVVAGGGAAFAGIGHAGNIGPGAGGVDTDPGPGKLAVAFHGVFQGTGQKKCRGIL